MNIDLTEQKFKQYRDDIGDFVMKKSYEKDFNILAMSMALCHLGLNTWAFSTAKDENGKVKERLKEMVCDFIDRFVKME